MDADRLNEDAMQEQLQEMASSLEAVMLENATLTKFLAARNTDASVLAEVKRLTAEVAVLRERNAGLLEEKNSAIRAAKKVKK